MVARVKLRKPPVPRFAKPKKEFLPMPVLPPREVRPGVRGAKPGKPYRMTSTLKDAILAGAAKAGEDNHGKNGLTGYLQRLATFYPEAYVVLLRAVLPLLVNAQASVRVQHNFRTPEEIRDELKSRGIIIDHVLTQ